jgi:hypothetical protein
VAHAVPINEGALRSRYNPTENEFAKVKLGFLGKDMIKENKTTTIAEENKTRCELKNTKGIVVDQDHCLWRCAVAATTYPGGQSAMMGL